VIVVRHGHVFLSYQLALVTPGNSPRRASCLRQIRHSWNFR